MTTNVSRVLALVGAALLVLATLLPINGGGVSGYEYALYDNAVDLNLRWFALEPLGVAVGVVAVAAASLLWAERALYGLLAAAGAQTTLFFVGYLGNSIFAPSAYNSPAVGGALGIVGALAILAAGMLGFTAARRDDRARAARRLF